MRVIIFENVNELNKFVVNKKRKDVDIVFRTSVVGETKDKNGEKKYEVVDRFCVIED